MFRTTVRLLKLQGEFLSFWFYQIVVHYTSLNQLSREFPNGMLGKGKYVVNKTIKVLVHTSSNCLTTWYQLSTYIPHKMHGGKEVN